MSNDDEGSLSFSDAYEGSSYSQFYFTLDGSSDGYNFDCETKEVLDSKRVLTVGDSDSPVDIESSPGEFNVLLGTTERDCRICHLSLQVGSSDMESGTGIQLGCSCKNDIVLQPINIVLRHGSGSKEIRELCLDLNFIGIG
ncbi:E3 ubiquitin-protein like [Heracleum sosnowskyi]|uniref:E3 ubiquitin-protein like n=1 Tax=Heracleum sosnowskyi TaxID=360622 RepID=A0AAD8LZM8_9APIA|nr:E3 ubiquitin-protein like [Heracleum sosnowskyi]